MANSGITAESLKEIIIERLQAQHVVCKRVLFLWLIGILT